MEIRVYFNHDEYVDIRVDLENMIVDIGHGELKGEVIVDIAPDNDSEKRIVLKPTKHLVK